MESFNITRTFTQRKLRFIHRLKAEFGLQAVEPFDYTDTFIEKFRDEIEKEPPRRFADVYVDVKTVIETVS